MTRIPNTFVNPAETAVPGWPGSATQGWNADGSSWDWPLNHSQDGEGESGITRRIEPSATTSGLGFVRQQGADEPMVLSRSGVILEPYHHDAMVAWARFAQSQTIYFEEFDGGSYEVLVTGFRSKKEGVMHNPRGGTTAPLHIWRYTLELDVVQVLAGTWT